MAQTTAGQHDHAHERGHEHGLAAGQDGFGTAFALGLALNLGFVAVEAACGIIGNSMALLADAGHNLGDALGIAIAWGASILARRQPSHRYTYGLRSSSILAALFNAIVLLIAVGGIAVEAINRLASPAPVASRLVMAVAAIGIAVNGASALLFLRGQHGDINIRATFQHLLADAGVSLAVVAAGAAILVTGWSWLDPAMSLVVAAVIVLGSWRLLRDAVNLALHGVPPGIDAAQVRRHLDGIAGVAAVHDLHIWPMSTTETALTCHLVMPEGTPGDAMLAALAQELHERFDIDHATIQVETGDPDHPCKLVPDHVV
ncbi:MAG TPA: cation diffusion facilitator family transporter [Stellaceae bacterium]|nr:cation diffusion facilitator family transporter [Stellaceae bacterium]